MATKPANFLNWLGGLASPPAAYLQQPPSGQRTTGWISGEPGPFQYENYIVWLLDQWIQYLSAQGYQPASTVVTSGTLILTPGIGLVFASGSGTNVQLPSSAANLDYDVIVKNVNWSNPSFLINITLTTGTDKIENGSAGVSISIGVGEVVRLHADGTGNYYLVNS